VHQGVTIINIALPMSLVRFIVALRNHDASALVINKSTAHVYTNELCSGITLHLSF
jgi:hypothetical protein